MNKTAFTAALLLFGATQASELLAEVVAEASIQTAHEAGAL